MQLYADPFPHAIEDGWEEVLCARAAAHWPGENWAGWGAVYDSPLEHKRTCNDWHAMPEPCRALLRSLLVLQVDHLFTPPLIPDFGLWGGGMHGMGRGGHLDLHLDADTHPDCGLSRRLNAVLFLDDWPAAWGGALEFWDAERTGPVVHLHPALGRLVVFETSDVSYHGVPKLLTCPPGYQRKTLACWWYGPAAPSIRPRASFVGHAGEVDPVKEALRESRMRPPA